MTSQVADRPVAGKLARGAWLAVWVLTFVNVINYVDRMLIVLLSAPIKQEFDLSDSELSLLSGLGFVTVYSIAGVVLARIADRVSRRGVIAASLAAWSVMTIVCGAARNFPQLLIGRAGVGIGEAGGIPPSYSIISGYFDASRRALPIAIFSAGSTIGILLCFMAGGAIYERWGWRATFFAAAVPGLLLAILVPLLVGEPPRSAEAENAPPPGFRQAIGALARNRPFVWLICAQSITAFGGVGILQWLPLFLIRSHGVTVGEVGLLFGPVIAIGMTIGLALGGWAGVRLGRRSPSHALLLCIWPTVALVPLYWIALWLPSREGVIAAIFVATLTSVISAPPYITAMQSVSQEQLRSTAAAVAGIFSSFVAQGLIPLSVGIASDLLQPRLGDESLRVGLTIVVTILLAGAYLFYRASRSIGRSDVDYR